MIRACDITVVVQGDLRPITKDALKSVRTALPGARLVLSTFQTEKIGEFADCVDDLVLSPDPGAQPPFVMASDAAPNNTNRQLLTTQAGLARVKTPFAVKMRTDCVLCGTGFVKLLEQIVAADGVRDRLVVSSFYTRHPRGLACYLFHVSDWFAFGATARVKLFFGAPLMPLEEATWFERHAHLETGTYAARRFRARFTPEQYITNHFAHALGYKTPHYLNDVSKTLVQEYEFFLANEVIVAAPRQLGFAISKYQEIDDSFYQRLDCLSLSDWRAIYLRVHGRSGRRKIGLPARKALEIPLVRYFAHRFRHVVIRLMLGGKRTRKSYSAKGSGA